MSRKSTIVALVALYVLVYIALLGVRPLMAPDETRYAEIPREMIGSGNWVTPRINGLRYFEKPPLGYWITATSILAFGENEFAVRLPSAVSVGLTAVLIFLFASRSTRRTRAGLLTAAVYLTSFEVFVVGVTNILDSLLTLLLTAAMATFYWAHSARRSRRRSWLLVLFGICCGLAFLTKGFLGVAIPALVAAPFLVLQRRWRVLFSAPWPAIGAALAVALPWSVMIHLREPDFWRYFFWVEHVDRFLGPADVAQHAKPPWFLLKFLIGSMLLWIPLLPAVVSGCRNRRQEPPALRFAVVWFVVPLLFMSVSSGKLGTYLLPCFPPLAVIIGLGLDRYLKGEKRVLLSVGGVVSGALGLAVAGFIAISQLGDFPSTRWFDDGESWKWVTCSAAFAMWAVCCLLAAGRARAQSAIWLYSLAPVLFMLSANFVIPKSSGEGRMPGSVIREYAVQVPPGALLFADDQLVHAICWYLARDDVSMVGREGELRYGLSYPDSAHRMVSDEGLGELIRSDSRTRDVVVIIQQEHFEEMVASQPTALPLPAPEFIFDRQGLVLARYGPTG